MNDAQRFASRVRVYYEDTDAGGIVYHASYLRWMERVRTDWLRELGARHGALAEDGLQCVVSELTLRYRAPAHLDDLLDIDLSVVERGRASLRLAQQVRRVDDGRLLTDALVRVAIMNRTTGKPAPLPPALLDSLRTP